MLQNSKNEPLTNPLILFIKRGQILKTEFGEFLNISNTYLKTWKPNLLFFFCGEVISNKFLLVNSRNIKIYQPVGFTLIYEQLLIKTKIILEIKPLKI